MRGDVICDPLLNRRAATWNLFAYNVNLLNPKSDLCQISPFNITPESHDKVMRIKEMITNERSF